MCQKPNSCQWAQTLRLDKTFFTERVSRVSDRIMISVEEGLRTVLAL